MVKIQAATFVCRSCASSTYQPVFTNLPDRLVRLGQGFDYVRCERCALFQIREVPIDLARYYQQYGPHAKDTRLYSFFRRLLVGRSYVFPRTTNGRLLDYGCGSGWYLKAMATRGWDAYGYEPEAAFARLVSQEIGLPVASGPDGLAEFKDFFDLVTLNHSIEHVEAPGEVLLLVRRVLRPGGRVVIALPNIESVEARVFKDRWFHLEAPRHLSLFSKSQLTSLLAETGFDQIEVRNVPIPTGFAGSLSYLTFGYFHPLAWYPAILPGIIWSSIVRDGVFRISARKA